MERTLITGDVILLNKLILGPRLPRYYREIPWCSTLFCLIKTNPEVNRRLKWRNIRLSGFRDISRGDILVFNLPKYENQTIVKRCVGLPGEMIYVKNNEVYINHKASDPLAKEVSNYRLFQTNKKDFPCITDNSRKYDSFLYRDSLDICISYLDLIQLGVEQVYNKYKILDNGSKVIDNHFKKGDKDNYPEIQIPFKGLELELNEKNKIKYQPMLSKYEGLEWNKEFKEYLYNGKVVKNHIFKNNYYFMMGDNRTKSIDSRYWGAVPEELIIGMATNVLWNINKSDD